MTYTIGVVGPDTDATDQDMRDAAMIGAATRTPADIPDDNWSTTNVIIDS